MGITMQWDFLAIDAMGSSREGFVKIDEIYYLHKYFIVSGIWKDFKI